MAEGDRAGCFAAAFAVGTEEDEVVDDETRGGEEREEDEAPRVAARGVAYEAERERREEAAESAERADK